MFFKASPAIRIPPFLAIAPAPTFAAPAAPSPLSAVNAAGMPNKGGAIILSPLEQVQVATSSF